MCLFLWSIINYLTWFTIKTVLVRSRFSRYLLKNHVFWSSVPDSSFHYKYWLYSNKVLSPFACKTVVEATSKNEKLDFRVHLFCLHAVTDQCRPHAEKFTRFIWKLLPSSRSKSGWATAKRPTIDLWHTVGP